MMGWRNRSLRCYSLENSDFLNGMVMRDAIGVVIEKLEQKGIGTRKVNFKMRDAAFKWYRR